MPRSDASFRRFLFAAQCTRRCWRHGEHLWCNGDPGHRRCLEIRVGSHGGKHQVVKHALHDFSHLLCRFRSDCDVGWLLREGQTPAATDAHVQSGRKFDSHAGCSNKEDLISKTGHTFLIAANPQYPIQRQDSKFVSVKFVHQQKIYIQR